MPTDKPKRITAGHVNSLLATRYCPPEWALFFEVANGTGTNVRRWADAVAMSIWPSRGLTFHGFEVKVSKSDFMSEIQNPQKADSVMQHCEYWWLVAPKEAVDETLIPETWGWLKVETKRLVAVKPAPKIERPADVKRQFVAALVRRAHEQHTRDFNAEVSKRVQSEQAEMQQKIEREVERRTQHMAKAEEKLKAIMRACGDQERFATYFNDAEFCAAVRLVREAGLVGRYSSIISARNSLKSALDQMDKALDRVGGDQIDLTEILQ